MCSRDKESGHRQSITVNSADDEFTCEAINLWVIFSCVLCVCCCWHMYGRWKVIDSDGQQIYITLHEHND